MRLLAVAAAVVLLAASASATIWYFSGSGDDADDGKSWAKAKRTPYDLRALTAVGDTVFFGTGTYDIDTFRLVFDTSTTIACSSFADTNADGDWHYAKLFGGRQKAGWTVHSGNIYKAYSPETTITATLFQDDSLIKPQTYLADVNVPGEFARSGDTLYAYVYNTGSGYDPDNYYMRYVWHHMIYGSVPVTSSSTAVTNIFFYGLHLAYAYTSIFRLETETTNRNLTIRKCKLTHTHGVGSENPATVYTGGTPSDYKFRNLTVAACSIGFCYHAQDNGDHGDGISFYTAIYALVESTTFFGRFTSDCMHFKRGVDSSVARYNILNPSECDYGFRISSYNDDDSFYFNVGKGHFSSGFIYPNAGLNGQDRSQRLRVLFNTLVGDSPFFGSGTAYNGTDEPHENFAVKYNVHVQTTYPPYGSYQITNRMTDTLGLRGTELNNVVDSNAIYLYSSSRQLVSTTYYTVAQWQDSLGFDVNSDYYISVSGLGFIDYPNDLRRTVTGEVSGITIDGISCTKYGAYQDVPAGTKRLFLIGK